MQKSNSNKIIFDKLPAFGRAEEEEDNKYRLKKKLENGELVKKKKIKLEDHLMALNRSRTATSLEIRKQKVDEKKSP